MKHVESAYSEFDERRRRDEAMQADTDDLKELESAIPQITDKKIKSHLRYQHGRLADNRPEVLYINA